MDWNTLWPWLVGAFALGLLWFLWHCRRLAPVVQAERARESFRLQVERLAHLFLEKAAGSGTPRGLRWIGCDFDSDVEFLREKRRKRTVAIVGATIRFEAIEGGEMEEVAAVPLPRQGSAILFFERGVWSTEGRTIFNLRPAQVAERLSTEFNGPK